MPNSESIYDEWHEGKDLAAVQGGNDLFLKSL
jgi:hypothetical protein